MAGAQRMLSIERQRLSVDQHDASWVARTAVLTVSLPIVLTLSCSIIASPQKRVAGDYYLTQWEGGPSYYLEDRTRPETQGGGGVISGLVQRLGWSRTLIIVNRHRTVTAPNNDWILIDVQTHDVRNALSDEEFVKLKEE